MITQPHHTFIHNMYTRAPWHAIQTPRPLGRPVNMHEWWWPRHDTTNHRTTLALATPGSIPTTRSSVLYHLKSIQAHQHTLLHISGRSSSSSIRLISLGLNVFAPYTNKHRRAEKAQPAAALWPNGRLCVYIYVHLNGLCLCTLWRGFGLR